MIYLNRKTYAATAADRWKAQYESEGEWGHCFGKSAEGVWRRLVAAGDDAEAIERITGNDSWTKLECNACGQSVPEVVVMSHQRGDDVFIICRACFAKVGEAFE